MYMVLEPGEVFEHAHADPSITMLVDGDVEFSVDGTTFWLIPNERVHVPAGASHVLVNRGTGRATVECGH